jgi:membrane glycosyltransferase
MAARCWTRCWATSAPLRPADRADNARQHARDGRTTSQRNGVRIGRMRRLLLAVLYLAMVLVGAGLSVNFFLIGGRSIIVASLAFAALGAYLLWTDFLSRKGPG